MFISIRIHRGLCVICFGLTLMIGVAGEFLLVVLATLLAKIFRRISTTTTTSPLSVERINLLWRYMYVYTFNPIFSDAFFVLIYSRGQRRSHVRSVSVTHTGFRVEICLRGKVTQNVHLISVMCLRSKVF